MSSLTIDSCCLNMLSDGNIFKVNANSENISKADAGQN